MQYSLRDYQRRAIDRVHGLWASGTESVLLVSPTGSGKTIMGMSAVSEFKSPLWIVHRRELVAQTNMTTVKTIQGMIASGERPEADVVVFDEAHHYVADQWRQVSSTYAGIPKLGLTATPMRSDGRALGDMFDELVIAATYSHLINEKHIVPARVYRPIAEINQGIALDPVSAYQNYAEGTKAFLFAPTVENAREFRDQFNDAGIPSALISGKMPKARRDSTINAFRAGAIQVLCNVFVLTEGVDIPEAKTVIFARSTSHAGAFMQMAGRVLRPCDGKDHAIIIDLPGITYSLGSPTSDREYSLDGVQNMKSVEKQKFKQCPQCAQIIRLSQTLCDECGYEFPLAKKDIRIYSRELKLAYAGQDTPEEVKKNEWNRLCHLVKKNGWSVNWALKKYSDLFGGLPVLTKDQKDSIYYQLKKTQVQRGYKRGWIYHRYKQITGENR